MIGRIAVLFAVVAFVAIRSAAWAEVGQEAGLHGHGRMENSAQGHGHWSAPLEARATRNPVPVSSESIVIGALAYQQNCAACHGAEGRGDGPATAALETAPADLFRMAPMHSDGDLAWKITHGRGEMPGWRGILGADEIWHIVNYLRHLPQIASTASQAPKNGATGARPVE